MTETEKKHNETFTGKEETEIHQFAVAHTESVTATPQRDLPHVRQLSMHGMRLQERVTVLFHLEHCVSLLPQKITTHIILER